MERFAERMLEEMERDHARGGLTMEYRRAYLLAGREYLHELIYTGACEASHFELLEPHIPGLTYEFFRKRLRGSFQHFLLKLLTGFQKRYRAD